MSSPIKVYCTDSEKTAIQTRAKAAGYDKLSPYIRDAALDESSRMILAELIGYMVQLIDGDSRREEQAAIKGKLLAIAQLLLDGQPVEQARADVAEAFWHDHQSHPGEQCVRPLSVRA
ncbi:MAG: hypothetical protein AAF703_19640 [Cyanobacteria bacterium P01_D01_bin.105]